jgi:diaminopimelate decarboxylase
MMDDFHLEEGSLRCEAVSLSEIAEAVGTPVYVYSAAAMCRQVDRFRHALDPLGNPLIAYSVKANSNAAVVATLARAGLGADIVSGGEYRRAIAAGVKPECVVFSGVGKTEAEMRLALHGGLFQFNIESFEEAVTLSTVASSMGMTAPAAFRINPGVGGGGHAKITTGAAENKFGIPIHDALDFYARASGLAGLQLQGVAVHIGSQLSSLEPFEQAFTKIGELIRALRSNGHSIATADLGGGLGVPYNPDLPPPPSPEDYGAMVCRITRDWNARLLFEPGRLIVGNAGVLLSRVIRVKPGAGSPFVIVDAAMNDLMRPALYEAWHKIDAVQPAGGHWSANVVGPVCETGDTFATARKMDRVGPGDLVAFRTAGAYAATMSGTYNSRPLTPEVLVQGGRWAVVRPRVDVEALIAADSIPDWLDSCAADSSV